MMNVQIGARRFANRAAAGDALADALMYYRGADLLVLGLPRGGVPVAARVAEALHAELDVIVARKLGSPGTRPAPRVAGRIVILVDDGLATGATMHAAARAVRKQHPARLIVAAPVGSHEACEGLAADADEVICPWRPEPFGAVGTYYQDFAQTTDEDVRHVLQHSPAMRSVEPW